AGDSNPARIDSDDLHAAFSRRHDVMREDQRRRARVVSPEQEKVTVRHVGRRNLNAKRISKPGVFVPVAYVGRGYPVRTAEKIKKTRQPPFRIGDRSAARRALGKRDGARAVAFANRAYSSGDIIECFVPTDSLPTGIGIGLRTSPFQR